MYHTILVPLDGSRRAEAILPHVEELAQQSNAKVIFVRVVEPEHIVPSPPENHMVMDAMRFNQQTEEATRYLASLRGEFREKGLKVRTYVAHGSVVGTILDIAEREDVDLIAMASHGRTGLARVFYGSVAAGVLHRIDRPLLLIRSEGIA
jgi:nucleotide-binding universal stress UspA family protein